MRTGHETHLQVQDQWRTLRLHRPLNLFWFRSINFVDRNLKYFLKIGAKRNNCKML
jgi:hypothetical protein